METGAQDWNFSCGVCHVGGGQMEYDRDRNPYSASSPSGDATYYSFVNGSIVPGFMSNTNKAEVDCLLCHLNDGVGMSGNGLAWLQSLGCGPSNPIGPINDPTCSTSGYTPSGPFAGMPGAGPFTPGTDYDMYNRNLALKMMQFDWAASLGIGATVTWDMSGNPTGITGVPSTISGNNIQATPNSQNCSVCHARDDNTPGLPGMINMKYGYGNYALITPPGMAQMNADGGSTNDELWFELGCKTGMGKRAHRIDEGPNDKWGMSMFNVMFGLGKNPGDPITNQTWDFSSMGMGTLTVKERIPDADVHDMSGMNCGTCHYTLGSTELEGGSRTFPAGSHHGVSYPSETVFGIDHNFAQADSLKDTYGKNWLDGTVSCEACHITRTHPRLTDNGGTLVSPTPTHAGFPSLHLEKIACATCHIPETYSAPGRLKYRDWTVGAYKKGVETNGGFRNMLDWNYDLITGSHKTTPVLHVWATKEGEKKIYPVLPSEMPIWVVTNSGGNGEAGSESGVSPDSLPTATSPAPAKHRDTLAAAMAVEASPTNPLRRAATTADEINGGNMVPLFDGFSLADAWSIDTKARVDAMVAAGAGAKLKVFHAPFDVTHGVVPKEWALGGSKRGGCESCHSSIDLYARNVMGMPTGPNPNYSPNSVGFFESYQQPLEKTGFGIGQYDLVKNWFSLFADYDCTMMCGGGMQPDSTYFDMAGNPQMGAACGDPFGMGWTTLGNCVDFMTGTFDAAMGFPSGTAMMMGMYDGIAGLQGFVVRETEDGATHGCQPFAGPFNSPVAQAFGVSVNNCMPAAFSGACTGPQINPMWPASCAGGFRNGQGCATNADCEGTLDAAEAAHNPFGLIYQRAEVRDQFKIMIQQSGTRLTWPIAIEQNPDNPAHVTSWDMAGTANLCGPLQNEPCCTEMDGMTPASCSDGKVVKTTVHANQFLGYDSTQLASLQSMSGIYSADCTACHTQSMSSLKHPTGSLTPSTCASCHSNVTGVHTVVAVDVQTTCASCHGGGTSSTINPPAAGIMWFGTAELTVYAAGMHDGVNTGPRASNSTYAPDSFTQVGGVSISFTDTSTDNAAFPANAVQVIWGDGQVTNHNAGSVINHTYASAGTYTIRHTVRDAKNLYNTEVFQVKMLGAGVTAKYSISVNVTDNAAAAVQGAAVYLKKKKNGSWVQIKFGYTDASGNKTFDNLAEGKDYKVIVYKSAIDFDGSKLGKQAKARVANPGFTLTSDKTVDIQQGTSATNGPTGKEWKGTNGTAPTVSVTP